MKLTGDDVRVAMIAAGIDMVNHHDCSLCGVMVFYSRVDDELFFNPECGCSSAYPRPASWDEVANWINMQTKPEIRNELRARFGLQKEPA